MMNKAEKMGLINGIQLSPSGPTFHHLLFADDNLFLFRAYDSQTSVFQKILKIYGEATGQVINLDNPPSPLESWWTKRPKT